MFTLLLGASLTGGAAPLCTSGSLDNYLGLPDGCTVGDKWFSNFRFVSQGDQAPAASQVLVYVDSAEPLGLAFSSARWNLDGNDKQQSTIITYMVTVFSGPDLISGLTATATNITASGPTTGTVTLTKLLCPGGEAGCASPVVLSGYFTSTTASWLGSATWDPVPVLGVTDRVDLWTGRGTGQKRAILGGVFSNEFVQIAGGPPVVVPEPHGLGLLALGLGAFVLARRHRRV